jgi:putative phosphoesterase
MKLGVIADIHGNLVALTAVIDDMPPVDRLVCAGDVVGYNPWHGQCVNVLRGGRPNLLPPGWKPVPTVMGNHDRAVVDGEMGELDSLARAGVEHARDQLDASHIAWLAGRPTTLRVCDDRVKVVHGHPDKPFHYTFPDEFAPSLLGDEDVLVMGHTHHQHHEIYDEGIVMNPGSVGQPRDEDYRAAYAVLDTEQMTVTEHRVSYDTTRVIDAVEAAGLPLNIGFRLIRGE